MLDRLRNFALVVEHRSFTVAARHAHLSQPALSASIKKLEEETGAELLHRGPGGATPTAAGAALLPRARAALAAVEEGLRAVREVQGLEAGEVRLGGGATVCTYHLPPLLAAFRKSHPKLRLRLREATTDEVLDALQKGELDLGLVTSPEHEHWRDDELVLVGAPSLDPEGAPFVTFTRGAVTRTLFDRHFPDANVVVELGSIAAVKGSVRAGLGLALVSRVAVEADVAARRLAIVPHPATPVIRPLHLAHLGAHRLTPAAAAFRALLLAHRAARQAPGSRRQAPATRKPRGGRARGAAKTRPARRAD